MGTLKSYTLMFLAALFLVISCAALFFSYRAYVASNRAEKNFKQSLGDLAQEVNHLKSQLAAVRDRPEDDSAPAHAATGEAVPKIGQREAAVRERAAIERLEEIVESTGLDQLAENRDMDPALLSELYDEYADRRHAAQKREEQLAYNRQLHKADADQYGQDVMALYERARIRRRGSADRQDSDDAFAELMERYPEAYATGMAIAERALVSGFRRNTAEVEKYYDMLRGNENFSHIVTDRGVEAVPNVEYYLTRQYLRQGDTENALALMDSLEKNYPDSLLFTGRSGGGRRWQPALQVVANLRREVE